MKSKELVDESPDLYILYIEFLKNRRGHGEDYTIQIMKVLREHPDWVRARDLKSLISCPEATLFRLLEGLTKNQIVENNKRLENRNVSSYRLSPSFPEFYFLTDKEIRANYNRLSEKNLDLEFDLSHALSVLKHNKYANLLPEYKRKQEETRKIGEGYQKWKERKIRERKMEEKQN
jgi:hypothetical protein